MFHVIKLISLIFELVCEALKINRFFFFCVEFHANLSETWATEYVYITNRASNCALKKI